MKVVIFHQLFSTHEGATATRSYTLAQRLQARGHRVTVVCAYSALGCSGLNGPFEHGRRTGTVNGIKIVEFKGSYSNYQSIWARTREFLIYALATAYLALSLDYDIVFCKSAPLTAGIPGVFAAVVRRKPYVFEAGDLWPAVPRAMGLTNPVLLFCMWILEWANYRAARLCIGVAPGIIRGFLRRGVPESRTALVPNGCDLDLFHPKNGTYNITIPGTQPGDFVAVYAGAHGLANGLDTVVEAGRCLDRDHQTHIKIVLIGDGALKPSLQEKAIDVRNIIFLDPMPKRHLANIMRAADCGIVIFAPVPLLYDCTSPNKFYDYIALGIPVVVAYPGWIADLVTAQRCGKLAAPGDPEDLATALRTIASDPEEARGMGIRSRALAIHKFDRVHLADSVVDQLETLVGE